MDRRTAKELLHLRDWLVKAETVTSLGQEAYLAGELRLEAGDSLMMKIGETANRLARAGVEPPDGVRWAGAVTNRNWLIHQYDTIDRAITWATLTRDLPAWSAALAPLVTQAEHVLDEA